MVIKELERFQELAESFGNKYLAVKLVSFWARDLGIENKDYHIIESKLIEWVITGKCPYTEKQLERRKVLEDPDGVEEFLCWVSDKRVSDYVKCLYKKSVRCRHLILCQGDNTLTQGQIRRINILIRMLWWFTSTKEGE